LRFVSFSADSSNPFRKSQIYILVNEESLNYFRPQDELRIHRGNLPHWRQEGVCYFVTTRLFDSMPQGKLTVWREQRDSWLSDHGLSRLEDLHRLTQEQQNEFHASFTEQWHAWLDAGYGECHFRRADVREILIRRLSAEPSLDAWVIMPNHLHALVAPREKTLGEVVQSWKGGSAFEINRLLGRKGGFWQKEPYDHIVRSEAQWQHYRRYIAENPGKAFLRADEYAIGFGGEVFSDSAVFSKWLAK